MSAEASRRALAMTLSELVRRYQTAASRFGDPVPFSVFELSPQEAERVFSGFDEDYHISRFFHFSKQDGAEQSLSINGERATHVALDPQIESIL